jgi:hypothetical protein
MRTPCPGRVSKYTQARTAHRCTVSDMPRTSIFLRTLRISGVVRWETGRFPSPDEEPVKLSTKRKHLTNVLKLIVYQDVKSCQRCRGAMFDVLARALR